MTKPAGSRTPITVDEADEADAHSPFSDKATRRLVPSLGIMSLALFATYGGLGSVLLPNQLTDIDAAHKVQNLAVVATISFLFTLFAQPVVGAFSDRTRSRLGRRAPWMIVGVAVAAAFMIAVGSLRSIAWIAVFAVVIQVALNMLQGPLSAILPDRFPHNRRGIASAMIGLGSGAGGTLGIIIAGQLANDLTVGYSVFGGGILVVVLLFLVVNHDFSSKDIERSPFRWKAFFAGFWINPRKHPDFAWAFGARFLFILGYFSAFGYMLFILTDYIGLSQKQANAQIGFISVASLIATVVSVPVAGWLSDRLGRRKIFIFVASGFMIVGLLMPLLFPTVAGMIALSAFNGLGFGVYLSCDTALMTEVLPQRGLEAGKDLGILNVANNIPQAISAIVAALVITHFGGYPALFVFGMVCVAVASLAIIPIKGVR